MMDRESKKGVRISTVTKRYTAEVVHDSLMKAKLLRSTSLHVIISICINKDVCDYVV